MLVPGDEYGRLMNGNRTQPPLVGGEPLRSKTPVLLTIAIMIIGILAAATLLYLPGSNAPQVSFTLHDSDGVKTVAPGETAEYIIRVENTGQTTGHYTLGAEGEADGWSSAISHESLHLPPGEHRLVSLFVTPENEQAEPRIDVNVVATRADNVTIVSTTTYLTGQVLIRKADETLWRTFTSGSGMEEGDDLKTGYNSYVQVDFGDDLLMSLAPETEIHCRFSNVGTGVTTFWFDLMRGSSAFDVMLPNDQSSFTLTIADGSRVRVVSREETIFRARDSGKVEVLMGTVLYEGPPTRNLLGTRAETEIGQGMDNLGNTFDFSIISVLREKVNALITNGRIGTMGFDNSGSFVADGNLDGFLFRGSSLDRFFIFEGDSVFIEVTISPKGAGPFDVTSTRYDPEPSTFKFDKITTASQSVFIRFEPDTAYISTSSDSTYDMEIRNAEGETHSTKDIPLKAAQGNSFEVEDFDTISESGSDSVVFGLDENGDEIPERTIAVSSGRNGEDVLDDLPEDDDDEDSNAVWIAVVIVLVVLAFVVMFVYDANGGFGRRRTRMTREEEFAQKRAELLRKQKAPEVQTDGTKKDTIEDDEDLSEEEPDDGSGDGQDDGEDWDDLIEKDSEPVAPEPMPPTVPDRPEPAPTKSEPEPVLGARDFTPGSAPPPIYDRPEAPESWAPTSRESDEPGIPDDHVESEPDAPPHLYDFEKALDDPEYQNIDATLAEPSVAAEFTDPGIMRKKVEKEIKEIDEWWDNWNDELDEIMKM